MKIIAIQEREKHRVYRKLLERILTMSYLVKEGALSSYLVNECNDLE